MTAISTGNAKAKAAGAPVIPLFDFSQLELPKFDLSKFDLTKFDLAKFDLASLEAPAAFREIAEQGIAQAKASYEKAKAATEAASGAIERSYAAASEGTAEYNRHVIDATRTNLNAGFDFVLALLAVKSPTDVVELSTAHAREQFQALTNQAKVLGELVQKLAAETAEPIQTGVTRAFRSAA